MNTFYMLTGIDHEGYLIFISWSVVRMLTTFSTMFDKKARFDIGLKLLNISLPWSALLGRDSNASLGLIGIALDFSDKFTILVIIGSKCPKRFLTSHVGMGSRSLCLDGEERMIFVTSSSI